MLAINDDFTDEDDYWCPPSPESDDAEVAEDELMEIERELFSRLHYSYDDCLSESNVPEKPPCVNTGDQIMNRPLLKKVKEVGNKTYQCENCRVVGHLSKDCYQSNDDVCILCGELGHLRQQCPNIFCFNCKCPGHRLIDCTINYKKYKGTCHRCKMFGHNQNECPDLWRRYRYTTTKGPCIASNYIVNKRIYCFNCGERGHYGYECVEEPMNSFTFWSYPFVVNYGLGNSWKYTDNNNNSKKNQTFSKGWKYTDNNNNSKKNQTFSKGWKYINNNNNNNSKKWQKFSKDHCKVRKFAESNSKIFFPGKVHSEPNKTGISNETHKQSKSKSKRLQRKIANIKKKKKAAAACRLLVK